MGRDGGEPNVREGGEVERAVIIGVLHREV
jgi:hypothetical protein